jgi:hypothetical protein
MKTRKIIVAFVAMLALTIAVPVETVATPPHWAPAHGYREKTRQIYFPQQNFYYDLHRGVYIYMSGRNWVVGTAIPSQYRGINLRVAPQVQLNIISDRPYVYNRDHRVKYWNSKTQRDYFKRMEKERKEYRKEVNKARKDYYTKSNKAVKKYYKNNGKGKGR